MTKLICSHLCFLILLVGLVWPVCGDGNEDVVWLNEVNVLGSASPSDTVASLEFVGRPVQQDDEDSMDSIEVSVKFYGRGDQIEPELKVTLTPSETGGWNGNYVGTFVDSNSSVYGGAFPRGGTIGGISITYGGEVGVYCWGIGAQLNADLVSDGSVKCRTALTTDNLNASNGNTDIAMWNKESGTPTDGGTRGDDFNWGMSLHSTDIVFWTIGYDNVCPEGVECADHVIDQQLAEFTWGPQPNENVVWLNEVNVVGGQAAKGSLEFVGRPVEVSGRDPPASIETMLTFYDGSGAIGTGTVNVLLYPTSTGEWKGNYMGKFEDSGGTFGAAFPSTGETAGVKVEALTQSRVYCWGASAAIDARVATGVPCQSPLFPTGMNTGEGNQVNVALYTKATEAAVGGGTKETDFDWLLSQDTSSASYATIGDVNDCVGVCTPTIVKQVLANYEWETSTSTTVTASAVPQSGVAAVGLACALIAGVV